MDAKEISRSVRDYFSEVHGQYGVLGFRVEVFEPAPKDGWKMECSFLPTIGSTETERINYKIIISSAGEIKNVTKISRESPPLCTGALDLTPGKIR